MGKSKKHQVEHRQYMIIDEVSMLDSGVIEHLHSFIQLGKVTLFSLLPFSRHYSHTTNCFLDFMIEGPNGSVEGNPLFAVNF
jgi:hypothetical protein